MTWVDVRGRCRERPRCWTSPSFSVPAQTGSLRLQGGPDVANVDGITDSLSFQWRDSIARPGSGALPLLAARGTAPRGGTVAHLLPAPPACGGRRPLASSCPGVCSTSGYGLSETQGVLGHFSVEHNSLSRLEPGLWKFLAFFCF